MSLDGLSINLATVRKQWGFAEAVDACLRHGITTICPWRDQIAAIGLAEAARIVRSNGLKLTGLCRGGFFPAPDAAGRAAALDDNRRAVDEAAELGADCLVHGRRRPAGRARRTCPPPARWSTDGLAALMPHARAAGVPIAIEPLHPMYAADRACVNSLEQALDICEAIGGGGIGAAIDVYHVWWEPDLANQIARAGRMGAIFAHHICDWLVPTKDLLNDRGMMGDGVDRPARPSAG